MQSLDVLLVQPLLEARPPGVLVEQPRTKLDRDDLPALTNAALQALEFFSSHHQHQQAHLRGWLEQGLLVGPRQPSEWPLQEARKLATRALPKERLAIKQTAQPMFEPEVLAFGQRGLEQREFERRGLEQRGLERLGLEQQEVFGNP